MEEQFETQPRSRIKIWIFIIILASVSFISLFFIKTSFTISQITGWTDGDNAIDDLPPLPEDDPDRVNILLLGMRGINEPGDGKLLSDAIILASIKKSTGQVALISLPRDLYARIWCTPDEKKINFAFAYGGLDCAKNTVALITDLYIDHAVGINFEALKEVIDTLGGIDIYLDRPFEEDFQWAKEGLEENDHWMIKEFDGEERWVFYVPEGKNHLDGEVALYYVRSRYSTDDFDRMHRQQQVLMAIKEKALSLNVLANPIKIYNLLDLLGDNIRTDVSLSQIGSLIGLTSGLDKKDIRTKFFDIGPEGLLYHTFIDEEYVLLPVGDNFDKIQEVSKNIFN